MIIAINIDCQWICDETSYPAIKLSMLNKEMFADNFLVTKASDPRIDLYETQRLESPDIPYQYRLSNIDGNTSLIIYSVINQTMCWQRGPVCSVTYGQRVDKYTNEIELKALDDSKEKKPFIDVLNDKVFVVEFHSEQNYNYTLFGRIIDTKSSQRIVVSLEYDLGYNLIIKLIIHIII